MAISVAKVSDGDFNVGNKRVRIREVTFTGSYATGGEAIAASQVGLNKIIEVIGAVTEAAGRTAALPINWDRVNGKLRMYENSGVAGSPGPEKGAEAYAAATVGYLTFVGR